jgi:Flp pilus assembly protein TadD
MIPMLVVPIRRLCLIGALLLGGCAADVKKPVIAQPAQLMPVFAAPGSGYGLFLSAMQAFADGDLNRSARYFEQASASDPDDPLLRARAFDALLASGQVDRANQIGAGGLIDEDESVPGLFALSLGVQALAEGRSKEAATAFRMAPPSGAIGIAAALLSPWAFAQAGDWKAATAPTPATADRLVVAFGGLARAQLLERGGRTKDAETAFKALVVSKEPLFVLAYGAFLERLGRWPDAANLYALGLTSHVGDPGLADARKRALAHGPAPELTSLRAGAADSLVELAVLLVADHQPELALRYLRLALRLDPDRAEAWVLTGEILEQMGDKVGGRNAFLQVKPANAAYSGARLRLAISFQNAGDRVQALKIAKDAAAASSGDASAQIVYAEMLRDGQRYDEAIAVLNGVIAAAGPKGADARLYYLRGANEERAGRWSEAEADLRKSLRLAPNAPDVLNYLGFAWVDRGEHLKEALDMLQRAVALAPGSGAILDSLGWARFRLKDFSGAVRDLERAAFLEASDAEINDHLGDAYWRTGRRVEANYQWRTVLTLSPDDKLKTRVEQKLKEGLDPPQSLIGAPTI